MINFEEELKKFKPSKEIEQAEDMIMNMDLRDMTDIMLEILKDKLPRYMLPNRVKKLETMPLTANGKLDRVTLKNLK